MGRTWRKNSEYGSKRDSKDKQKQVRKRNKKLKKLAQQKNNDQDIWFPGQRGIDE